MKLLQLRVANGTSLTRLTDSLVHLVRISSNSPRNLQRCFIMATTSATTPLTIKVRRGDELRRFTVDVPIEFAALSATVRSLFSLPPNAPMVLKYQDNEGDLITVSSDVELVEAIRVHAGNAGNILRLDLLVPKVAVAAATATAKPPVASSAAKSPVAKAAPAANPPIDALPVVSLRPGGGVPPPVAATSAPAPTLLLVRN